MNQDRILLVYNHWEWKPLAVLSLLIRMFTYGPNHAVILKDDYVHEMVGSSFIWAIKRFFKRPVSCEPNQGCGYKVTHLKDWLNLANREVIEMKPLVPIQVPIVAEGYGFFDLIQIFLHIVRKKWLLIGNNWNGKDGTRLWPGIFCSEFIGLALGRKDAHILTPADLQYIPELIKVREFSTFKK